MRLVNLDKLLGGIRPISAEDEHSSMLISDAKKMIVNYLNSAEVIPTSQISDGDHTFADLYEQRLILSAALANNNPKAWKSRLHDDGEKPFGGGWFIMGFDTAEGPYTYHYRLEDWSLFNCKELDRAKPYDGHTSKDVRRLLSL